MSYIVIVKEWYKIPKGTILYERHAPDGAIDLFYNLKGKFEGMICQKELIERATKRKEIMIYE